MNLIIQFESIVMSFLYGIFISFVFNLLYNFLFTKYFLLNVISNLLFSLLMFGLYYILLELCLWDLLFIIKYLSS